MAVTTFSELPLAIALNGNELVCLSQPTGTDPVPWVTYSATVAQIAAFASGTVGVSMRQLVAALAQESILNTVFQSVPADINDSTNIAWFHGSRMTIIDPFVTGFLQPVTGYSDLQMAALFALASTLPV